MAAAIVLRFDPSVHLGSWSVRLETLALAGVVLLVLLVAAWSAGRTPARGEPDPRSDGSGVGPEARHLRRDDLILIALGAVPGAVAGGRLGYVLLHLDYYAANPNAVLDPAQGSASLTLAIVLGTISGCAVARLLDASPGRWLQVAAVPLLVATGLGKLAMVLGGAGQGSFSDAAWATSYAGAGPWQSANADVPAVPSQVLEGLLVLAAAALLVALPALIAVRRRRTVRAVDPGRSGRRDGWLLGGARRFLVAFVLWSIARFVAVFTWRDAVVASSLRAEQLVLASCVVGCLVLLLLARLLEVRRGRRLRADPVSA